MKRRILQLSLPNIITNITVPLVGIVDLAIAGRLDQSGAIGAVVVGSTIFNFIYLNFGFLRMGTCGFTSQAYGAKDVMESARILVRSLIIGVVISFLILLLGSVTCEFAMDVMKGSDQVEKLASTYFFYRIFGAPAVLAVYSIKGWLIGMQKPVYAMFIAIMINVVNIIASIVFAFSFNMGVAGIGLGSAVGQWTGVFVSYLLLKKKYGHLFYSSALRKGLVDLDKVEKFFSVNIDIFLRTFCLVAVLTYFTIASSEYGDKILEANALLLQLFTIFSYMIDGVSFATESLVGNYYGARRFDMLSLSIKDSALWGLWMALFFSFIYLFFSKQILEFFNPTHDVLSESMNYVYFAVFVPLAGFFAFIYDGVLVGLTHSKLMRNVMFVAAVAFFALYFSLKSFIGNNALWIAFIVFLLVRSTLQPIISYKYIRSKEQYLK